MNATPPGLFRRLAAMAYDLLLVLSLLVVAVALFTLPYQALTGRPFPERGWLYHLHQLYLLCVFGGFHLYFWIQGGQTLGMRAWGFRLLRDDGKPLTLADGLKRLFWATLSLAPLGLLPMVFDPQGRGFYDRRSHTRPVRVKKAG